MLTYSGKSLLYCQESNVPDRHRIQASREPVKNTSRRMYKKAVFKNIRMF